MEELYLVLDDFSFIVSETGRVRSFRQGEILSAAVRSLFGESRVPVATVEEAGRSWWCRACKTMHPVDSSTCEIDVHTHVWRVPVATRVSMPTGGIRAFAAGSYVVDPQDREAIMRGNVLLELVDGALCSLKCPKCGAEFRRVMMAEYVRQEVHRLRARERALLEQAAQSEREHEAMAAEQRARQAAKTARSYERIRTMKARKAAKEGR